MPRVKLEEQPRYEFAFPVVLQPRDINFGGHLGNDALVSLIGSARADMFHSMGLSEGNLGDNTTGVIMADLVVNYKAEAFMFDELIIDTHVGEIQRSGFRLFHRIRKADRLVALVETGMTTFSYTARRIVPVPGSFLASLDLHGHGG